MEEFDLLRKTELRVEGISLENANLNDIAAVVSETLGLEREEVLVTDASEDIMTIDILRSSVDVYNLVGKKDAKIEEIAVVDTLKMDAANP